MTPQRSPLSSATINENKPLISAEEHQKRLDAVNFGRSSVQLSGFTLDDETEALYARYVNGELDHAELTTAILRLSGLVN
ncbi:antitoxin VbhA family protein [Deinococcus radiomollis]|uniref:antitoxin VbhA family protein n=1 Tax=Deinococcus radiomollis TaxID=468916 RepID=UPI0038923228